MVRGVKLLIQPVHSMQCGSFPHRLQRVAGAQTLHFSHTTLPSLQRGGKPAEKKIVSSWLAQNHDRPCQGHTQCTQLWLSHDFLAKHFHILGTVEIIELLLLLLLLWLLQKRILNRHSGDMREFCFNNIYSFLTILKFFYHLQWIYLHKKSPKSSLAFQVTQILSLRFSILFCCNH